MMFYRLPLHFLEDLGALALQSDSTDSFPSVFFLGRVTDMSPNLVTLVSQR